MSIPGFSAEAALAGFRQCNSSHTGEHGSSSSSKVVPAITFNCAAKAALAGAAAATGPEGWVFAGYILHEAVNDGCFPPFGRN
jgi:hypothetical protein